MSKAKLEYARELIKDERYEEARTVLREINHPTAEQWLKKLDALAPPKPSSQKGKYRGCWLVLLGLMLCAFVGYLSSLRSGSQNQPSLAGPLIPAEPTIVEISDPYSTGLPENFLSVASENVAQHGYVSWYEAVINTERRLMANLEVTLTVTPQRSVALQVIADLLRQYAKSTNDQNAGRLEVLVSWQRGTLTCIDNAGVGFLVMREIDWGSATQEAIFRAIDQDIYADGLDGETYGLTAWAPDPSGIRECNL